MKMTFFIENKCIYCYRSGKIEVVGDNFADVWCWADRNGVDYHKILEALSDSNNERDL